MFYYEKRARNTIHTTSSVQEIKMKNNSANAIMNDSGRHDGDTKIVSDSQCDKHFLTVNRHLKPAKPQIICARVAHFKA